MKIPVQFLGQSGLKFVFGDVTVYVDPYLSNSVAEIDGPDLKRLVPIPFTPQSVTDANWVLLTHTHIDHCDPETIPHLANSSPLARFIGPYPVVEKLKDWGIPGGRIQCAEESWFTISPKLKIHAIPAAHPAIVRDSGGNLEAVGYLIEFCEKRIYIAGDTFVHEEILSVLISQGPIQIVFLPINEHNFFRARRGIIGNLSVHEAFQFAEEIGAKQLVPIHWDMFEVNAVDPEEIRFIYIRKKPAFELLMQPTMLNLSDARISIIIRTLNEAKYLDELLTLIQTQQILGLSHEVIIVDSGSTDGTLHIAERHGCKIIHISREEFSFGRSLNIGCEAAKGDLLVFISGHCVPIDSHWLSNLCRPLLEDSDVCYTYGRQLGGEHSQFSEKRIFAKYFPESACIAADQQEFFCNNANAAIRFSDWQQQRFDEELTGLEDMELAQRLLKQGGRVAYLPNASVYHHHSETWLQVQRRFEREAIALQKIMPQIHFGIFDFLRYFISSTLKDWRNAFGSGELMHHFWDIPRYRWNQYLGSYRGNHYHRRLSHAEKDKYFYPS